MKRTFNEEASNNWDLFRSGVKAAIRGGIEAMRQNEISKIYIAGISTGLYAGIHRGKINGNEEFEKIVDEVCNEVMADTKRQRCADFTDVIYVKLN